MEIGALIVPTILLLLRSRERKRLEWLLNVPHTKHKTHNGYGLPARDKGSFTIDESNENGNELDPVGSNNIIKTVVSSGMAYIASIKESIKSHGATRTELESYHHAEQHPFFNESL